MSRRSLATAAIASVSVGVVVAVFNMFDWERDEYYFAHVSDPSSATVSFYGAESISIFLLLLGFFLTRQYAATASSASPQASLLGIIGGALTDRRLGRAMVVGGLLYGVLYAFASSIVVYQPSVDFATAYGATGVASWSAVPCCGDIGTVPTLVLYLTPAHLALQLVPLSVLLLFVVPPLVGLNLSIALLSVRRTVTRATGRWMVACGAAVGLFTACPTCAGFFLAESVGGIGATTLAVALAPYQAVFIGVSIPLLVSMPFLFAVRIRNSVPAAAAGLSQVVEAGNEPSASPGNR